jgi:hypothetical protein
MGFKRRTFAEILPIFRYSNYTGKVKGKGGLGAGGWGYKPEAQS